jgi:hypothetical protein
MLVDVVTRLLPPRVEAELEALHAQLQGFCGHRAVWLDRGGQLWHAEPDELLEDLGHVYVGTFFRPALQDLGIAVSRAWLADRPGSIRPSEAAALVSALA